MNQQKSSVNTVLVIIIIVLIAIIGYFIFIKKSAPIPQQQTPATTQTKTSESPIPTNSKTIPSVKISNVLPSGSIFRQGEGAMIPLSWSLDNLPAGATIYLDLLSSDGLESFGRITNNSDCSKGGDTIALAISVKMYKWDGLYVCSNWQAHSVNPGSYKIGVSLYSANGTSIIATGQSGNAFSIQK